MSGIFFQYGTAAHLAILTVAPLFLFAVCDPASQAIALGALSLFAALWILMNPAQRRDEWPRDARRRIGWELLHDPFLSFCGVALVIALVRAFNGGIGLDYNASSGLWHLKDPMLSVMPGSVTGAGWLPFAGLLGVAVVVLGTRHALGSEGRGAYLLLTSVLAALAVVFWRYRAATGVALPQLALRPDNPFSPGTLLGVYFVFAIVAWIESWVRNRAFPELLSAVSAAVLLAGMLYHAPTFPIWLFVPVGFVLLVAGVLLSSLRRSPAAWLRAAIALLVLAAPAALVVTGEVALTTVWPVFPKGFLALREAAASVALEAWKGSLRFGLGLGAYPLALGFHATPENWQVLSISQTAAPYGWIHFLFERGLLGAIVFLIGLAILLRDAILSFLRAGGGWRFGAVHFMGLLVFLAVTALLFVDCSFIQIEALMPVGAAWALSVAALPDSSEADHG